MSEETINYLVYDTEADAIARADTEGARRGYSYHRVGIGTRFTLTLNELTDDETAAIVTDVTFPTEEE